MTSDLVTIRQIHNPLELTERDREAAQARASSSRLTRSSWRTWPHRKLRRNVPRARPRESGGWRAL